MKRFTSMACGIAAASILSCALTACDNESPSAPVSGDEKSSAVESSDAGEVSSSSSGVVARCDALSTECGYSEEELCKMGVPGYCGNELVELSSSSGDGPTSSSGAVIRCDAFMPECGYSEEELCGMGYYEYCASSSSTLETCIIMDELCPSCNGSGEKLTCPVTNEPCNRCSMTGERTKDCKTGMAYVCKDGIWRKAQEDSICVHITDVDGMTANGNCNSDTDLESVIDCATGREFRCIMNYWTAIDLCPPGSKCNEGNIVEEATDVSAMNRGGPAVAPSVVKVRNANGSITFRDDGILVDERCTFNGLRAELSGDTLLATILYPGCTATGGFMGVITFTLSEDFVGVKYIKYDDKENVQKIREAEGLLPCGNNASCTSCGKGMSC
ncbi:MAG: hypothetical protein IK012_03415 [Fibrobacter sp.]|uniref:hypothetical protein n=1 Tax=Fibrobacter sp. TaxID=35828 RepID=UPI0025B812F7|nr:hypothetical protein [Fibrobacter sp.]MBR4784286.1 hypothetical protein [Fibrobacter sp.]